MKALMVRFWMDDCGAIVTTELVFLMTLLVIGLVSGMKAVQQAVNNELEELASAIGALSQSYSVGGVSGCCAQSGGSFFFDDGPNVYPVDTCTAVPALDPVVCVD